MKKTIKSILLGISLFLCNNLYGQEIAVKSNLLYDATTSMNLGAEFGLGHKTTLDISGNVNPWTFSDSRKMKHWMIQPELRFWSCERFNGFFWGIHGHYAKFNINKVMPFGPNLDNRYQGWLAGGGVGIGNHWILSNHWSIEAEIGVGYAYIKYDKFPCANCGAKLDTKHKNYIGPTKAALSLIYVIK